MTLVWVTTVVLLVAACVTANEYTDAWAVEIQSGNHTIDEIAAKHGFKNLGQIGSLKGHYHFRHLCGGEDKGPGCIQRTRHSEHHTARLSEHPQISWAQQQKVISRSRRRMISMHNVPNHTRRSLEIQDPQYSAQWNIENTANANSDMNIRPVWEAGITGKGVVVTIVDDGMEHDHPDLEANYDARASTDVNGGDDDPYPDVSRAINSHGTRCSGVIGASKNDICSIGIAYESNIGAVRMLDGEVTDLVEAKSLSHAQGYVDIYTSSWGPNDDGTTIEGPAQLAAKAIADGVQYGRDSKGSIYIFASGNGGASGDSCNCDGYCNSIFTIAIGALTESNQKPYYTEPCSATMAVAYSSGGGRSIPTSDIHHGCTISFSGTSAAAPQAAGIFALVLQANPSLTWRDVQHLVVQTSDVVDESDRGWTTNKAGHRFNNKYGFGRLNALALVNTAKQWTLVDIQRRTRFSSTPQLKVSSTSDYVKTTIVVSETDTSIRKLEHVQVVISASTVLRGQLHLDVECPDGTRSNLLTERQRDRSSDALEWTFMTVECWDEQPFGIYTLYAKVHEQGAEAVIHTWGLAIHGTGVGDIDVDTVHEETRLSAGNDDTDATETESSGMSSELMIGIGVGAGAALVLLVAMCVIVRQCAKKPKYNSVPTRFSIDDLDESDGDEDNFEQDFDAIIKNAQSDGDGGVDSEALQGVKTAMKMAFVTNELRKEKEKEENEEKEDKAQEEMTLMGATGGGCGDGSTGVVVEDATLLEQTPNNSLLVVDTVADLVMEPTSLVI